VARVNKTKYQLELIRVAKNLGLSIRSNVEAAIIDHCKGQLAAWVRLHGQPKTLTELLDLFGASLDMKFVEIKSDADLDVLLKDIPPSKDPVMARVPSELDDATDAITVYRSKCEPWDRRFLAVVNCRDWHARRAFFTKWHEIVHRIIEGQQLRLAFRKTRIHRTEAEEVLVDRVAATLAFYPDIFKPVITRELASSGKLTFEVAGKVRQEVAPEASLQSTLIACLGYCTRPTWFVTCGMGYKRELERKVSSGQGSLLPLPPPQLRVQESGCSPAASKLGIMLYPNMRVPESSVIARTFADSFGLPHRGTELLSDWQTSTSGPVGHGKVEVEAFRRDDEVWALLTREPRSK
jgi:hypothetical protein